MKKYIFCLFLVLIVSGCNLQVGNNPLPTPTGNYVAPTKPEGDSKHKFEGEELTLELFFKDNQFVYFGTVTLPNPCYKVNASVTIAESFPEQVTINIITTASEGICAEVIDERKIAGEIQVSENASFNVMLNGNLIEKN